MEIADLTGHWLRSTGEAIEVEAAQLQKVASGILVYNGWVTTQCSRNTVVWTKSGQELMWHRVRLPSLGDLAGCWVNSEGLTCNVVDNTCTFSSGGRHLVEVSSNGVLVLNGCASIYYTSDSVMWMKSNAEVWWYRRRDLSVEALAGLWVNSKYQILKVEGAKCMIDSNSYPIQSNEQGALSINGWTLMRCGNTVVGRMSGQHDLLMRRVRMPSLGDLAGSWVNSQGLGCNVVDNTCIFNSDNQPSSITMSANGALVLNSCASIHYTGESLMWMKSDEEIWWYRRRDPSLEALAGLWV